MAKPKKRSRLALPRQRGAAAGSSDGVGLCHAPAASPAGALIDGDCCSRLQAKPLPAARATTAATATAVDHASPRAAATTANSEGHHDHQQPVSAACRAQEQMEVDKEEAEEDEKRVESHAARVSDGMRPRDPLQTLRLNLNPDEVTPPAASVAAAVAAAASEVSQLLDGLEHEDTTECRPPRAPPSPPTARQRAGASGGSQQRSVSASKLRCDLQHQGEGSAGRKRPRPVATTTTTLAPSASSRKASSRPRSESRRTPSPPSPKRGRAPPPPPPPPPVARAEEDEEGEEEEEEAEAGDVVMLDDEEDDFEPEDRPPLVPVGSAAGARGRGGERGAADEQRWPRSSSPAEKQEHSPVKRERCPVCSCAVWGLSNRARQASLEKMKRWSVHNIEIIVRRWSIGCAVQLFDGKSVLPLPLPLEKRSLPRASQRLFPPRGCHPCPHSGLPADWRAWCISKMRTMTYGSAALPSIAAASKREFTLPCLFALLPTTLALNSWNGDAYPPLISLLPRGRHACSWVATGSREFLSRRSSGGSFRRGRQRRRRRRQRRVRPGSGGVRDGTGGPDT